MDRKSIKTRVPSLARQDTRLKCFWRAKLSLPRSGCVLVRVSYIAKALGYNFIMHRLSLGLYNPNAAMLYRPAHRDAAFCVATFIFTSGYYNFKLGYSTALFSLFHCPSTHLVASVNLSVRALIKIAIGDRLYGRCRSVHRGLDEPERCPVNFSQWLIE